MNYTVEDLDRVMEETKASYQEVKAALEAGMNAHIAKPIDIPKMLETLAKILPA